MAEPINPPVPATCIAVQSWTQIDVLGIVPLDLLASTDKMRDEASAKHELEAVSVLCTCVSDSSGKEVTALCGTKKNMKHSF